MGVSQLRSHTNGSLRRKLMEAKARRRLMTKKQRTRSVLMKGKEVPEGSRRIVNPIVNKLKTLKRLVPSNDSTGSDGLFRDTAEYILALQMRVRVMQIMVEVLTGSS
ncbi:hypothetical protein V6N13_035611 [Hibiscus sabdariffa]|uniref:Uncharacterized protein n=1 Tax=Hibiscus sabdariffa TaxID=183260 RepID=A0ABR2S9K1_9ROSI